MTNLTPHGVRAKSAASFIDSIGVNAHWSYGNTPYAQSYLKVRDKLVNLGIKHVRGELLRADDLARFGIKTTLLIDSSMTGDGTPVSRLHEARRSAQLGHIAAVEGPNEADLFWVRGSRSYRGLPFPAGVRAWQEDLYHSVQRDSAFSGVQVIGPSLGKTYWSGGNPFRAGSLRDYVDFGNFHPYVVGNPFTNPSRYAGVSRYYWDSDFPSIALDQHPINFTTYRPPFGSKPMMATETGYTTWRGGRTEEVKARYIPRLFLENFRLGIRRTYLYQLVNENPDPSGVDKNEHWGLVNFDLSVTSSYDRLKLLIDACKPSGTQAKSDIIYPLKIWAKAPENYELLYLHYVVLAQSPTSLVVLIWHEVSAEETSPSDSTKPYRRLKHPSFDVALTWNGAPVTIATRKLDGSASKRTLGELTGYGVRLPVGDDVCVISIQARGKSLLR